LKKNIYAGSQAIEKLYNDRYKMKPNPFVNIENRICGMFEKKYGIFTRNGTTAIWVLLKALGISKRKIIVPVNICFVVVCAIILSDNEPYFVDIGSDFSIDPEELKDIDSKEAKAVIYPYIYGNTGSISEVLKIAKAKDWIVIEDVAQALGAKIDKKYAGSFTDFSITSFGMGKIIDVNIGGVLCINSKCLNKEALKIYKKLPILNDYLLSAYVRFNQIYSILVEHIEQGDQLHMFGRLLAYSYRNANISQLGPDISFLSQLEIKLQRLDGELDIRHKNAVKFQDILHHENIKSIKHREGATYWRKNILVNKERDFLLRYLKENGIKASKYFPSIDRLFYLRNGRNFKRSDSMAKQIINLWPGMQTSYGDIVRINKLIHQFYKRPSRS